MLSDLILTAVGLKLLSSGSGSSRHGVPASVPVPALAAFAVQALGLRTVRRSRLMGAMGGVTERSRSRFSSKLEDSSAREIQRDRVTAGGHARPWDLHT